MTVTTEAAAPADDLATYLAGDALALRANRPVLVGARCGACGTRVFPRPSVCPHCMSEEIQAEDMSRTGTLYAYSTVHVGARKWHKPFTLGYVDLDNGVRVFSHIMGDKLAMEGRVQLDVAELGRGEDGKPIVSFVFRPVEA
jgi:uncharacterized OB-fold protein